MRPTEPSTTFQDDTATFAPGFCGNLPDLTPRCWGNSGTFVYELSDGTLTVLPHEMPMNEAVQTYNAYVIANNTPAPYEPTPLPDGTVATGAPPFTSSTAQAASALRIYSPPFDIVVPREVPFCIRLLDGIERCFDNYADFVQAASYDQMTVVPEDISGYAAVATFQLWYEESIELTVSYQETQAADQS